MDTVQVQFNGKTYTCDKNRPLLFTLQEQGAFIPSSCQNGFCQACLSKVTQGSVPEASQQGLSTLLIEQDCFLPCICKPQTDFSFELATKSNTTFRADEISPFARYSTMVLDKTWLNHDVLRLGLMRPEGFMYKAGQWINLIHAEQNISRSYSLASMPCENFLELHIKRIPQGKMSNWLCDTVQKGDFLTMEGPAGDCYYQQAQQSKQPLILAGVGSGLAPLYGIVREALEEDHQGHIYLFHGATTSQGLYYQEELTAMTHEVGNFSYIPCVLQGKVPAGGKQGKIDQAIIQTLSNCAGCHAYLCGDDAVVQQLQQTLSKHGILQENILTDAFTPSS